MENPSHSGSKKYIYPVIAISLLVILTILASIALIYSSTIKISDCLCPGPTEWSACDNGTQSRTIYGCDFFSLQCVSSLENQSCLMNYTLTIVANPGGTTDPKSYNYLFVGG